MICGQVKPAMDNRNRKIMISRHSRDTAFALLKGSTGLLRYDLRIA